MAGGPAVERTLAVMCGAGVLPALVAERARAERWRVVAFTFDGATDLSARVARTIPSRLREFGPILTALKDEGVSAAVLVGRFSMTDVLHTRTSTADETALSLQGRAGSRIDSRLVDAIIALFAGVGVGVLDQRRFLGDLVPEAGCWSRRAPTADEWTEIRRGLALAREIADASIGQTIVLRYGAVVAVEAVEGTTEAVRRGTALAGPGAVIVKATARAHDYRFDTPTIGPETVSAAVAGGAAVLAVEAGRVAILDRQAAARVADTAGLSLLSVSDAG